MTDPPGWRGATHSHPLTEALRQVTDAEEAEEARYDWVPNDEWPFSPYDDKSIREIIDDYVLVRGDLSEEYAREQLTHIIERRIAAERQRLTDLVIRTLTKEDLAPGSAED